MSHTHSIFRVFSPRLIRARLFLFAFAGVLLFSGMARASLIPFLVSGPIPVPGGFQYNYRVELSADERLDPAATNGVTCPGPSNSNIQCNPAGTFFTLYDIPDIVSVDFIPDASTPAGGTFMGSEAIIGPTPNSINGTAFDSNLLVNITFTYTGPVVAGPRNFTGFRIVTRNAGLNPFGNFTSQSTNNGNTSTSGSSDQVIGSVPIPTRITAAAVNLRGRILTAEGRGVTGIQVTLTGLSDGQSRTVLSGKSGYYNFSDIPAGETYTVRVSGKRFSFIQNTQLHTVLDDMTDINFTAYEIGR